MQARSEASTELSHISMPEEEEQRASGAEPDRVDPFCLDCMAQPGQCSRHPLLADLPHPDLVSNSAQVNVHDEANSTSDCSSQVRLP